MGTVNDAASVVIVIVFLRLVGGLLWMWRHPQRADGAGFDCFDCLGSQCCRAGRTRTGETEVALRDRVIAEGLSVRATEQFGRKIAGPLPGRAPKKPAASAELDPDLSRLVEAVQGRLQTRVRLSGNASQGRLEIDYSSSADLERITLMLLGDV